MKCALVMTGGIAKGAFQAGVLKSFAEYNLKPNVIVGSSAGALNAGYATKLILEENFTPKAVESAIVKTWVHGTSLAVMWGKANPNKKDSIRNIFPDVQSNPFMIIRKLANLQLDVWHRLKNLLAMTFFSVFNRDVMVDALNDMLKTPKEAKNDIICAVTLTDLLAHSEYIHDTTINNYGEFVTFSFKKGDTNLEKDFSIFREALTASACFPGMFQPTELDLRNTGKKKFYVDGGITKNAPFGRAIKLDPEIEYIFVVTTSPITKPILNEIKDFPSIMGQVYEIVISKDIANDYRKVMQINDKIRLLQKILERDSDKNILDNEGNNNMCKLAGFKSVTDFISKRCVEIIFIEPDQALEGDPFSGFYRKDRVYLMDMYVKHGYDIGSKVLKDFIKKVYPDIQAKVESKR